METEDKQDSGQPEQKPVAETSAPADRPDMASSPKAAPDAAAPRRPRRRWPFALATLVVLVAIGIAWSWWLFGRNTAFDENGNVDHSGFQAVFLTNGQVYFGKLSNLNHKYVTITHIYYLQVQSNTGLQGSTSSGESKDAGGNNSQVSLAKLGSELHGPKDEMYIASDQVLFWENLNSQTSKVVQAIDKYQTQHGNQ